MTAWKEKGIGVLFVVRLFINCFAAAAPRLTKVAFISGQIIVNKVMELWWHKATLNLEASYDYRFKYWYVKENEHNISSGNVTPYRWTHDVIIVYPSYKKLLDPYVKEEGSMIFLTECSP